MVTKGSSQKFMKRKVYDKLLAWKEKSNGGSAILVEGARRVGKSYIVEEFARNEYSTYVMINFADPDHANYKRTFEKGIGVSQILTEISLISGKKLVERDTVIIFDEVQECPSARQAIKFLVADGRYDYIETGSLMSIRENVKDIVLPSEERSLKMYPMDFEEFCWALGDEVSVPAIREHFESMESFGDDVHKRLLERFRTYMIVGGMPTAVGAYTKRLDLLDAEEAKVDILELYRNDVQKRGKRTRETYDSIPALLMRHDKSFNASTITGNSNRASFEDTLFWLEDSMMVNLCFDTLDPDILMGMVGDRTSVKCYMGDTGLLTTMAISNGIATERDLLMALLEDKLHVNEGMFAENAVAQVLRSNGHDLYFHSFYNREENNNRYEIDFLVRDGRKVCPIEVKSSNRTRHASLDRIMAKHSKTLGQAYIINTKDVGKDGNIRFIPIYMSICL